MRSNAEQCNGTLGGRPRGCCSGSFHRLPPSRGGTTVPFFDTPCDGAAQHTGKRRLYRGTAVRGYLCGDTLERAARQVRLGSDGVP